MLDARRGRGERRPLTSVNGGASGGAIYLAPPRGPTSAKPTAAPPSPTSAKQLENGTSLLVTLVFTRPNSYVYVLTPILSYCKLRI